MLSALAGSTIPVYIIKGATHGPMHIRQGLDVAELIFSAHRNAKTPSSYVSSTFLSTVKLSVPDSRAIEEFETNFNGIFSVFSSSHTLAIERLYYSRLLRLNREITQNGNLLPTPNVIVIFGKTVEKVPVTQLKIFQEHKDLLQHFDLNFYFSFEDVHPVIPIFKPILRWNCCDCDGID